jgi:L-ascorbate metabolism protein UlaG (beta-lactamase superfamily)
MSTSFSSSPDTLDIDSFRSSSSILKGDKYQNFEPTDNAIEKEGIRGYWKAFKKMWGNENIRTPTGPLAVETSVLSKVFPEEMPSGVAVTWVGHSTNILQVDGVKILIDPVFSQDISPVSWLYSIKRFTEKLPISIEALPELDFVIISHNHYDHLDKRSIKKLKNKTKQFLVPLGVKKHLVKWGVSPERVAEMDWWDELNFTYRQGEDRRELTIAATPSRHFSGRSLWDRDESLWASWVFIGPRTRVYFSGDTGYGRHFKWIGDKYGPFDLTLMENGQYNERWKDSHMFPEEAVQGHLDVRGQYMIPIHWGVFDLSLHNWWEPVTRASKAAQERGVLLWTPKMGESLHLNKSTQGPTYVPETTEWWLPFVERDLQTKKGK